MDDRREYGRLGERLAEEHLRAAGMAILDRNWRCRFGEIDLVARDGDTLVVAEVKARRSDRYGTPADAVTPRKAARLRRLAGLWLVESRRVRQLPHFAAIRIDVLGVRSAADGTAVVEHLSGVA